MKAKWAPSSPRVMPAEESCRTVMPHCHAKHKRLWWKERYSRVCRASLSVPSQQNWTSIYPPWALHMTAMALKGRDQQGFCLYVTAWLSLCTQEDMADPPQLVAHQICLCVAAWSKRWLSHGWLCLGIGGAVPWRGEGGVNSCLHRCYPSFNSLFWIVCVLFVTWCRHRAVCR